MYNLTNKEKEILLEINEVINRGEPIFGYFESRINEDEQVFDIIKKLDDDGFIKVNFIDDYPLNIRVNSIGEEILFSEDTITNSSKNENIYRLFCFIGGIVVGVLIMLIKSNM